MKYWSELRVAYLIGVHGSATAAAKALGIHRTTVIRQLDLLEKELQQKLFIRHNKGITLNEAGKVLMQALQHSDQQINKAISMLKSSHSSLSGELIISSVDRAFTLLSEPFKTFLLEHPNVRIKFETAPNDLRLEYGEAHIAILPGSAPEQPDYIVQQLGTVSLAMYASKTYIAQYGAPVTEDDFKKHKFAVAFFSIANRVSEWFKQHIPEENIAFNCDEPTIVEDAIVQGLGMGLMLRQYAILQPDLVEVMPTRPQWTMPLWIVTHVDQHRVPKVQACVAHLKSWGKASL